MLAAAGSLGRRGGAILACPLRRLAPQPLAAASGAPRLLWAVAAPSTAPSRRPLAPTAAPRPAAAGRPLTSLSGARGLTPPPLAATASAPAGLLGPRAVQARGAGRTGGFKRKKKAVKGRTVHQKGLGKRMEFHWPRADSHRTRVPMYENSRRHVIFDHSKRKWMVMWYRGGIQVFRSFKGRHGYFEQGRAQAILFFKQLQHAGKLGRPKPDQCRSGVRGVYFDKEERSWVARWSDVGLKKYAVYGTQEMGFAEAYKAAVRTRIQAVRQNHQFILQRTRWKGQRRPLGTPQT